MTISVAQARANLREMARTYNDLAKICLFAPEYDIDLEDWSEYLTTQVTKMAEIEELVDELAAGRDAQTCSSAA